VSLPAALPPHQNNSFAWLGPDMAARQSEWAYTLSAAEIAELEHAAAPCLHPDPADCAQKIAALTRDQFPLPLLQGRLANLKTELSQGRGFALLQGLPVERYSQPQAAAIFCGLGSHLGRARSQNAQGHVLGHVRDLGLSSRNPNVRIYQTNERQTFHTDSADVVGLLCLKTARHGGDSLLVSSTSIYNAMLATRPDLLALLMQPIATDRRGEVPPGELPYFLIPVFNWHEGHLTAIYQRQYIDSAQRFPDAPRLTPAHVDALDMFDQLANSPELSFSMRLAPGDMQFVYNHTLLHDRTGFEDWPDDVAKRHLLRLWLALPQDRPLPPVFASRYGTVAVGDRGGVVVKDTVLQVPWSV
jgi:hypothetical protein